MLTIIGAAIFLIGAGLLVAFWGPAFTFYRVRKAGSSTVGAVLAKAGASRGTRVELRGSAEAIEPMLAPATLMPCLYFRHRVEERIEVDHTVEDGLLFSGESWVEVVDVEMNVPFTLSDGTGSIAVDPRGAKFAPKLVLDGVDGAPGYRPEEAEAGRATEAINRAMAGARGKGIFRTFEWVVPLDQQTYLVGRAVGSGRGVVVEKGPGSLVIGVEPEEWLVSELGAKALAWAIGCLLVAAGLAVGLVGIL